MPLIKIKNLKQCPMILEIRRTNSVTISRYRQAMRNGDVFPPITVDRSHNIIGGNHRYESYLAEFGEDHEVECKIKTFKDDASRIEEAVRDNSKHGNPLDGISRKAATLKLIELGRNPADVAKLIGISCRRVEEIGGEIFIVRGSGKSTLQVPAKRGPSDAYGRTVTVKEYQAHRNMDRGIDAVSMAKQLVRWLDSGWIDLTKESNWNALVELHDKLGEELQ